MSADVGAFLTVFPALHMLMLAADWVGEGAWNYVFDHEFPRPGGWKRTIEEFRTYYEPSLRCGREQIADLRRWEVTDDSIDWIDEGFARLETAASVEDMDAVDDYLGEGTFELGQLTKRMGEAALGPWGFFYFERAFERIDDKHRGNNPWVFPVAGYRELIPFGTTVGAEKSVAELASSSSSLEVTIHVAAFAVSMKEGPQCVLGNTKQFRLMTALAANLNRYVPFVELAELMGGDAEDVDGLPAVKCRLTEKLHRNGLVQVVAAIRGMDGHYGLFAVSAIQK